jgi:hypothetical protein
MLTIEDLPIPQAGPGQVVVKAQASGAVWTKDQELLRG